MIMHQDLLSRHDVDRKRMRDEEDMSACEKCVDLALETLEDNTKHCNGDRPWQLEVSINLTGHILDSKNREKRFNSISKDKWKKMVMRWNWHGCEREIWREKYNTS